MSKSVNSPTARLLQSSRLFSLPRPLPQPLSESLTATGLFRASDTATVPYPTHQAIATPASSLHRGDFGLKRSLPAKTTKHTSTPHVRVRAQDTFEHITDFASAADHSRSEAKWAQMGVPMLTRPSGKVGMQRGGSRQVSVYERHVDNTDPNARVEESLGEGRPMQRWKFEGPWIGGMQEGEFQRYLERTIEGKKGEWREFLRARLLDERVREAQTQAREQGEPLSSAHIAELREQMRPSDEDLAQEEKGLRDEHAGARLSSKLTRLIAEFLDLPALTDTSSRPRVAMPQLRNEMDKFGSSAPPTTHPGAGLSHIRSNKFMPNHPIHGPQFDPAPVEARVVRPRSTIDGLSIHYAALGVGGFVADDTNTRTYASNIGASRNNRANDPAAYMDIEAPNGNRVWVKPQTAYVDDKGRIRLQLDRAGHESLAVKQGGDEVRKIHEAKMAGNLVLPNQSQFAASIVERPRARSYGAESEAMSKMISER